MHDGGPVCPRLASHMCARIELDGVFWPVCPRLVRHLCVELDFKFEFWPVCPCLVRCLCVKMRAAKQKIKLKTKFPNGGLINTAIYIWLCTRTPYQNAANNQKRPRLCRPIVSLFVGCIFVIGAPRAPLSLRKCSENPWPSNIESL